VNNKQRRAAKAKRRARDRARRPGGHGWHDGAGPSRFTARERIRGLIDTCAEAARRGDHDYLTRWIATLAREDRLVFRRESEGALLSWLAVLWDNGWQPAEVIRHARRADARAGRLATAAIAADHARRDPSTLHPRWAAQVEALDLPEIPEATGWLGRFARAESIDELALVTSVVTTLAVLGEVGPLPELIPPPGSARPSTAPNQDVGVDDPVLIKVRALLAQAESTTFEAEAAAFTAKAQELMARHAIDAALLWARSERDERPTTIRLAIDDPYADIKSLLLQCVSRHSRCTAVFHPTYGMMSVVGFATDVAATEMMFTSLLVQAQAAMHSEAVKSGPGGRTRSRSFRSSFLLSFTRRIDQRLAEINASVEQTAEADSDGSLLPVLAARDDAVDDVVREMFGELHSSVVRGGSDAAGWVRGKLAADLAQLSLADLEAAGTESSPQPLLSLGV
jgi:uncharacterized protein DUF2786